MPRSDKTPPSSVSDPPANALLRRYWSEFEEAGESLLYLGCGITAHDKQDAIRILRERVYTSPMFMGDELKPPAIARCVEDVDMSTIEKSHIAPNITASIFVRGVWWPVPLALGLGR
jgi:hypothetical protein